MTLRGDTPAELTTIQNWVGRTGGIHGQPRGIYCNCLHPLDRVVPALEHWLKTPTALSRLNRSGMPVVPNAG